MGQGTFVAAARHDLTQAGLRASAEKPSHRPFSRAERPGCRTANCCRPSKTPEAGAEPRVIAATIIHRAIASWAQTGMHGLVIWVVVSAIAVATGLSMRRWVEAVFSLRLLSITGRQLAFALYLAMILPAVLACVALSTTQHFLTQLGSRHCGLHAGGLSSCTGNLDPLGAPGGRPPALPAAALGAGHTTGVWPAWAGGVFCSMCGLPFMPTWFSFTWPPSGTTQILGLPVHFGVYTHWRNRCTGLSMRSELVAARKAVTHKIRCG
jgi:hypothetical protein